MEPWKIVHAGGTVSAVIGLPESQDSFDVVLYAERSLGISASKRSGRDNMDNENTEKELI